MHTDGAHIVAHTASNLGIKMLVFLFHFPQKSRCQIVKPLYPDCVIVAYHSGVAETVDSMLVCFHDCLELIELT